MNATTAAPVPHTGACNFDQRAFRDVVGHYASGITVVAGLSGRRPVGFTCQSFYSVSVDPPLISISVKASSSTYPLIRESGRFIVNVLAEGQDSVSNQFARSGTDKWAGINWTESAHGNPAIEGALTWLDCTIEDEHSAGDHTIVVGRVVAMGDRDLDIRSPLLYYRGRYCTTVAPDLRSPSPC